MVTNKKSIGLSLAVCFIVSALLLLLVFTGPWLFELYMTSYRGFAPNGHTILYLKNVFGACFYPCAVFSAVILYSLIKLLFNIKSDEVFTLQNVKYLKTISWCCVAIALITFVGGYFYMPFMFVAMAGGFVGVLLRVLKNVMQTALELREENDLTI